LGEIQDSADGSLDEESCPRNASDDQGGAHLHARLEVVRGGKAPRASGPLICAIRGKQQEDDAMSEDEQCGRWETTPEELKAEVRRLRTVLERIRYRCTHLDSMTVEGVLRLAEDALRAPGLKTD
jgi:hypothetical protein